MQRIKLVAMGHIRGSPDTTCNAVTRLFARAMPKLYYISTYCSIVIGCGPQRTFICCDSESEDLQISKIFTRYLLRIDCSLPR